MTLKDHFCYTPLRRSSFLSTFGTLLRRHVTCFCSLSKFFNGKAAFPRHRVVFLRLSQSCDNDEWNLLVSVSTLDFWLWCFLRKLLKHFYLSSVSALGQELITRVSARDSYFLRAFPREFSPLLAALTVFCSIFFCQLRL